ncbi:MAG: MATE family efflux transporter [Alphaproteobacteria bacterium]
MTGRRATHAQVWRLAGPIVLSNLSIPLLGAVDTAVMGHLPDPAYIGGVAIGSIIFTYVYWSFGFLRMGTTGFAAQALGAGDADELRAVLARGYALAAVFGALVIALQSPVGWLAFNAIEASGKVETLAQTYYGIRVWGAPAALANYVALGWLLGTQRPIAALVLTVFMNALNIVLSLYFVVGLGWTIDGVAFGTLIAEWSAAALGIFLIMRPLRSAGGAWNPALIFERGRIVRMMRVNFDIFIRTLCLVTAFAWFTARGATMGDVTLAANAVLLNFQLFTGYGLDGFAHAAEALVGSAVGKRDRRALRDVVVISSQWAFVVAGGFALVYLLAGPSIIALLTSIPEVQATAARFLPWVVVSPLVSVWSFQLDGIFIGATRGAEMRNGMIASLAIFIAAEWALTEAMGNHGLWLAFTLFMAARGITLAFFYPRIERALTDPSASSG